MAVWIVAAAILVVVGLCVAYLYFVTIAGLFDPSVSFRDQPLNSFAVVIPAHNEEAVIGSTLDRLHQLDYPRDMYDIHVVADNCSDQTAVISRSRDAYCWERLDEVHRSKGYALSWLFERVLHLKRHYDAVVIFDADSCVDPGFLRAMDLRLSQGSSLVQGRHVIANPADNWFTAAMYVAFVLDNLRNAGRARLGFSAKIMGDAVCLSRGVLERFPWTASSITEDAEYQAVLLLNGIRVDFAPDAVSYGETPTSMGIAARQRSRWMLGRADLSRRLARTLLMKGLKTGSFARVDGAIEQAMPSYSTLFTAWGCAALLGWVANLSGNYWQEAWAWIAGAGLALALYPVLGIVVSNPPMRLYRHLALAPLFIAWRTALRLRVRLRPSPRRWDVTPRRTRSE